RSVCRRVRFSGRVHELELHHGRLGQQQRLVRDGGGAADSGGGKGWVIRAGSLETPPPPPEPGATFPAPNKNPHTGKNRRKSQDQGTPGRQSEPGVLASIPDISTAR